MEIITNNYFREILLHCVYFLGQYGIQFNSVYVFCAELQPSIIVGNSPILSSLLVLKKL